MESLCRSKGKLFRFEVSLGVRIAVHEDCFAECDWLRMHVAILPTWLTWQRRWILQSRQGFCRARDWSFAEEQNAIDVECDAELVPEKSSDTEAAILIFSTDLLSLW